MGLSHDRGNTSTVRKSDILALNTIRMADPVISFITQTTQKI
jgi:hypothetical protein